MFFVISSIIHLLNIDYQSRHDG